MKRQKQILKAFKGNKEIVLSKKEIKVNANINYYCNTDKHLGDTLTRMVKNGLLKRVVKGSYRLGSGNKMIIQPKNQLQLI